MAGNLSKVAEGSAMRRFGPHSEDGVRRTVLGVLGTLALVLGLASDSSAFTPQFLQITVTKAELSTDGVNFTTLPGSSQTFTITGGNPGDVLGNLLTGVQVTPGNYTKFRVSISCDVKVKAQFTAGLVTFCTLAGGGFGACPAEGPATVTFTIPADQGCVNGAVPKTFDITLNVSAGNTPTLTVSFDNDASQQGDSVGPPPSKLEVQK